MVVVRKTKEEIITCPQCGKNSWITTTQGTMCRECKYVQGEAPFVKEVIHK